MVDLKPDHEQEIQEFEAATSERPWMRWLKIAIVVIIGLLIVVFGARWVYQQLNHNSTKQPAVTTTAQPLPAPTAASNNNQPTTGSSPTDSTPTTGSSVPNTGPGSTLAIFLGATVIAASLHLALSNRSER